MASKNPPKDFAAPKHTPQDTDLDRAPHEPKGARLASDRGSLAQGGVDIGSLSPGKTGGANLA